MSRYGLEDFAFVTTLYCASSQLYPFILTLYTMTLNYKYIIVIITAKFEKMNPLSGFDHILVHVQDSL